MQGAQKNRKNRFNQLLALLVRAAIPVIRVMFRLLFRIDVRGIEKLDFNHKMILIPNHVSLLDPIVLALIMPKEVTFAVNTGIYRKFSWLMSFRTTIPVDPMNPYSVRKMMRGINANQPLCIFPEGRVNVASGGALMKVYGGIGYLALSTGASLYPVAINGMEYSKLSYLKGKVRQVWFPRVAVAIGDPFTVQDHSTEPMRVKKTRATEHIRCQMTDHLVTSRLKPDISLFNELLDAAAIHGKSYVVCEDAIPLQPGLPAAAVSYAQLLKAAYVLGGRFRELLASSGSGPGESRVGVLLPNSVAHMAVLFALFRIAKTPAMLNYSAGRQAVLDACETAELRTVVTSRAFVAKAGLGELAEQLAAACRIVYMEDVRESLGVKHRLAGLRDYMLKKRAAAGDREIVLFTSGSESKPKGVCLTHANLFANIQQVRAVIPFHSGDRILGSLPLFHSLGLCTQMLLPVVAGLKVYMYPSPLHYKVIPELVYDKNITILLGTPTFLAAYARTAQPFDFAHSLRYVIAGAEKLKDEVRQLWLEKFHLTILEGYGTTETSPIVSLNTAAYYKQGSVGRLLPLTRWRLEPVEGITGGGHLVVSGPQVMKGYLIHGQGFVPCDGEHRTGDIAAIDPVGASPELPFLFLKDRLKRFAKIGGEMVPLGLIEEIFAAMLTEGACAAVSVPDARKGERVILYHTDPHLSSGVLKEQFKERGYSPLFMPAQFRYMVEQLPLLGTGKTDYQRLLKLHAEHEKGAAAV